MTEQNPKPDDESTPGPGQVAVTPEEVAAVLSAYEPPKRGGNRG